MKRRLARFRVNHVSWWEQEMPSDEEYAEAQRNLERVNYAVDYIITHCGPSSIVSEIGMSSFDPLTDFLEEVRQRAKFHYWLFGHYHDNKNIGGQFVLLWEHTVDFLVFTKDAHEEGIEVRVQDNNVWLMQKAIGQRKTGYTVLRFCENYLLRCTLCGTPLLF